MADRAEIPARVRLAALPLRDGWEAVRVAEARDVPALRFRIELLELPPTQPVLVARFRTDAPYPDVEVALPISRRAVAAWVRGDRSVQRALADDLEGALANMLAAVKRGEEPE